MKAMLYIFWAAVIALIVVATPMKVLAHDHGDWHHDHGHHWGSYRHGHGYGYNDGWYPHHWHHHYHGWYGPYPYGGYAYGYSYPGHVVCDYDGDDCRAVPWGYPW